MGQFCMDSTGPRSGRRVGLHTPQKASHSVPFRPIGAFQTVCAGPAQRQRAYTEIAYRVKVKKGSPAGKEQLSQGYPNAIALMGQPNPLLPVHRMEVYYPQAVFSRRGPPSVSGGSRQSTTIPRPRHPTRLALSLGERHVNRSKALDGQSVSQHILHLSLQLQGEGNAAVAQGQRRPFRQLPGQVPGSGQQLVLG